MNLYRKRTPELRAVFYDGGNAAEVMEFLAQTQAGPQFIDWLRAPCWVTVCNLVSQGVKVEQWNPVDFKTFFEPVGFPAPVRSPAQKRFSRMMETQFMKKSKTSG